MMETNATIVLIYLGLLSLANTDHSMFVAMMALVCIYFAYSYYGQQITNKAEEISNALYASAWLDLLPRKKKIVAIAIQMAQKPLGVTVGGFHYVSYKQFGDVSCAGAKELNTIFPLFLDMQSSLQNSSGNTESCDPIDINGNSWNFSHQILFTSPRMISKLL